jgi:hypothetical protein
MHDLRGLRPRRQRRRPLTPRPASIARHSPVGEREGRRDPPTTGYGETRPPLHIPECTTARLVQDEPLLC